MLEQYYAINKAIGVSINAGSDGTVAISACSVVIQNKQLSFEKKITDLLKTEDLTKHFPVNMPLALNLSGKGILHKQIEKTEEINAANFSKVLPNANPDDFYIQNFISGDQSFVSVIRKADADKWINELTQSGFVPLMLSLGPFPVQNIISQLNIYDSQVIFNGNIIQRDNQSNWISYHYDPSALSPFALKVELENIDEKLIVPYASAFQLVLASKLDVTKAHVESLEKAFIQKISGNKLKVNAFVILAVFFILLLVNFIFFSWLDSSNSQLAARVSRSAQSTTDVDSINKQIKQKEGLLHNLGWEAGINKSALIDQIAVMLPPELTWKEVAIDPIDLPSTRIQKSLVFYNRQIRVTGNSQKIIPVNEWIARIKTKAWVKNVQLENYTFNNELDNGQFTITINY